MLMRVCVQLLAACWLACCWCVAGVLLAWWLFCCGMGGSFTRPVEFCGLDHLEDFMSLIFINSFYGDVPFVILT